MSGYTVTITPSGGQSGPQTTIQVDTTSGAARVTELTVKAGGNGLSAQELPVIDLALLVAALAPGSAPAITATPAAAPAPAASTGRTRQARGRKARKAAEAPAKATRGRRRAAAAAAEAPKAGRAYRRMPPQDDMVAAWNESHSASALAAHFDVPRHTAQGWLRRLRSLGVIEPAS
jgi:hypothetical protein